MAYYKDKTYFLLLGNNVYSLREEKGCKERSVTSMTNDSKLKEHNANESLTKEDYESLFFPFFLKCK